MLKEKILFKLKKNFEKRITIFIVFLCFLISLLTKLYLITFILIILLTFNKFILSLFFGKYFIFFFKNYFLINHNLYGYSLKPNTTSKTKDFLIFDRFIYENNDLNQSDINFFKIHNRKHVDIDESGFRKNVKFKISNNSLEKRKLKIFCSGGSTTFGSFLNNDETWPSLMAKNLNNRGVECEIINGGVPGWSSANELARFKHEVKQIKPDILILHQGWNDEFNFSELRNYNVDYNKELRNVESALHFHTSKNFNILNYNPIIFLFLKNFFESKFFKHLSFTNHQRWKVLLEKKYFIFWQNNLEKFREICDEHNIKLYITDYPCLVDFFDNKSLRENLIKNSRLTKDHAEYQAISKFLISTFLENQNFAKYIPIDNLFENFSPNERLNYFHDEIHCTRKGNLYLSDKISNILIKDLNLEISNFYNQINDKKKINLNSIISEKYNFIDETIKSKHIEKFLINKSLNHKEISTYNYTLG